MFASIGGAEAQARPLRWTVMVSGIPTIGDDYLPTETMLFDDSHAVPMPAWSSWSCDATALVRAADGGEVRSLQCTRGDARLSVDASCVPAPDESDPLEVLALWAPEGWIRVALGCGAGVEHRR